MNKPLITVVIASSLDGRIAFPAGGGSHLGSPKDKKILNNILSNVDATLFGSGTLKAHQSTFIIKNYLRNGDVEISQKQPISIVAGDPNNISFKWKYFKQPIQRWLISSNKYSHKGDSNFEKYIKFEISWGETLSNLFECGIKNLALLGGSKMIYSLAKENLIDEIKITLVPKIIGGEYSWIPTEAKDKVFNTNLNWKINSIEQLDTDEIFIHYIQKN